MLREKDIIFNRYKINKKIGSGHFADVYAADDTRLGRQVAVKLLPIDKDYDVAESEAKLLAQLHHQNIITIWDFEVSQTEGRVYLIMEYAKGGALRVTLDRQATLPEKQAITYARHICAGLAHAHDKNVLHRDLKPENLFLSEGGLKIGDLGLARILEGSQKASSVGTGTIAYSAPEQFNPGYDKRADIWSVGIILFEMLTGDVPFHGEGRQIMKQILFNDVEMPSSIPLHLAQIINKALEKEPEDRFQTALGLQTALEALSAPSRRERTTVRNTKESREDADFGEQKTEPEADSTPDSRTSIRWYTYPSSYVSELLGRLASDRVYLMGNPPELVSGVDGRELLKQGCMSSIRMDSGQLVAVTDLVSLLGCGHKNLLKKGLESIKDRYEHDNKMYILRLYCIEENYSQARYELDKSRDNSFDMRLLILLAVGYGEKEVARQWLLEVEEAETLNCYEWVTHAQVWKNIFDDDQKARHCLEKGEPKGDEYLSSHYWPINARLWKQIFNDDKKAQRCLEKAEAEVENKSGWVSCAEAWKQIFDDDLEARRCLEKANEAEAGSYEELILCAEVWKQILDDDLEARRCLKEAEAQAESYSDWMKCFEAWKGIFDDDRKAQQCLKEAEGLAGLAEHAYYSLLCARAWKKVFGDDQKARRCMKESEAKARADSISGCLFLTWCAKDWQELFDDDREARRCLKEAEMIKRHGVV